MTETTISGSPRVILHAFTRLMPGSYGFGSAPRFAPRYHWLGSSLWPAGTGPERPDFTRRRKRSGSHDVTPGYSAIRLAVLRVFSPVAAVTRRTCASPID